MKIIVTETDIRNGVRRDASNCAVAQALRRIGVSHAGVAGTLVLLANGTHHQYVVLPGKVQEWIAEFDAGGDAQPMEFDLVLPEWAATRATRPTGKRTLTDRQVGAGFGIEKPLVTRSRGGLVRDLALVA